MSTEYDDYLEIFTVPLSDGEFIIDYDFTSFKTLLANLCERGILNIENYKSLTEDDIFQMFIDEKFTSTCFYCFTISGIRDNFLKENEYNEDYDYGIIEIYHEDSPLFINPSESKEIFKDF